MNAKDEFLEHTSGKAVLCALVKNGADYDEDTQKRFILRSGFSKSEFDSFIKSIDFEYDNGYGGQELFGNIWYKDGTWSDRGEYDGSEWWNFQTVPAIPKECAAETEEQNWHIAQQPQA